MEETRRSIFRQNALERYRWSTDKDVLPRVARPPAFLFLWLLLGVITVAGLFAWFGRFPTYASGLGAVTTVSPDHPQQALVFLPPSELARIRAGQAVELTLGNSGQRVRGKIETVGPQVISPAEARQRYKLENSAVLAITQPSVVVTVALPQDFPALYQGSLLTARVETGSRKLISLLPVLDNLTSD